MTPDLHYWALLLIPCLFWAAYHYYKDRHRPEPVAMLLLALGLGYFSAYISEALYHSLDYVGVREDAVALANHDLVHLFWYSILAIGPIEELAKFIPFLLVLVHTPHFDEAIDGVIYASFIALGFSINENQTYLLMLEGNEALARAIVSPMIHILFASIWGYAYGYADTHNWHPFVATVGALVLAMFVHGIFDFFSLYISIWTNIVPPAIILVLWLTRMWLIKHPR